MTDKKTFGTGRPATGRTHAITVRISEESWRALQRTRNKSYLVDMLIAYWDAHTMHFDDLNSGR